MSDSPRKEKKEKKEKKRKGNTSARNTEPQLEQLPEEDFGSGPVSKASLELKDCPVQNVTVYNDRAEVTRTIKTSIKAGTTEMSVNGISSKVDSNSVRVAGGKGAAVILEVSHNVRWEPKNKDDGTEQGRLKREQEELDEKIAHEQEVLNRIAKEDDWVEKWGKTLSTQKKESEFVLPEMMKQAADFMDFYHKKLADIDERRASVNKSLKELREQRGRVTKSLAAISGGDTQQVHEVLVLLAAKADTDVELVLSYVVMGAAWHAAYDVRVESAKDRLDLVYYGFITNNSLDNWEEAPLSLSTAKPSVGGAPPDLTTKFVGFRSAHVPHLFSSSSAPMQNKNVQRAVAAPAFSNLAPLEAEEDNWQMNEDKPVQVMTSAVQESGICTSFAIPRKTTILSDNKPHKVTIRMIHLKANFTYVIIPKLSAHAYLKASILNASEYPFLPGDINVFMDGNFVAKSTVPAVSPNETFSLFLGTDDAIKVTYPPGALYKETQGILKRSNLRTTKHTITIKNTKSQEVSVVIFDQLPKSNDSQIKVKLHKPTIVEGNKDIVLTEANNVKWKKDIPSGKEIKLPFEYSIEWPAGQELTM